MDCKKKVEKYYGWIYPSGIMKKKLAATRHGKLSDNTSQTSITMNRKLLERAKAQAKAEGRSLSNWIEQLAKKEFPEADQSLEP